MTSSSRSAGSYEVDNPDAVVNQLGPHRHPVHQRVQRLRHRGAASLTLAANTIRLGEYDIGIAVGMDKHLPGAFSADPRLYSVPVVVRRGRACSSRTKFFGDEDQPVHARPRHLARRRWREVAAKNYRNGALNPNAFRRKPMSEEEILESPMLNYPLTQYMFCSPDEGAAAVVLCRADHAHRYTDTPIYLRAIGGAHPAARRVRGAQPVAPDRADVAARPSTRRAPRTRWPASAPRTST